MTQPFNPLIVTGFVLGGMAIIIASTIGYNSFNPINNIDDTQNKEFDDPVGNTYSYAIGNIGGKKSRKSGKSKKSKTYKKH